MAWRFKTLFLAVSFTLSAVAFTLTSVAQQTPEDRKIKFSRVAAVKTIIVPDEELRHMVTAAISTWEVDGVPTLDIEKDWERYSYAHIDPSKFTTYSGIKAVEFEFNTINDFIDGKGIFSQYKDNSAKIVIGNVYGFEHDRATAVMEKAANSGLFASIIATDGPVSANEKNAEFEGDSKYTNKLNPELLSEEGQGKHIRHLLSKGYKFRSPTFNAKKPTEAIIKKGDYYITMSALYRNITIGPIQHLKEKIMVVLKDPRKGLKVDAEGNIDGSNLEAIFVISGNANATEREHNNLSRFFDGRGKEGEGRFELAKFTLEHTLAILRAFAIEGASAQIDDINFEKVIRIQGQSGIEIFERAYTDGKFEINDRLAVILSTGGRSNGERKESRSRNKYQDFEILNAAAQGIVTEIYLSHFVLTNRDFVDALFEAWKVADANGTPFFIKGVLDGKFVGMRSYGLAAGMKGITSENPFGKEVKAMGEKFAKYVDITVNIERRPHAKNINPDGPPKNDVLQHGKMTLVAMKVKMSDGTERMFYIVVDGSMNMSGNESNLEVQDISLISEKSELYNWAKNSTIGLTNRTLGKTKDGRPRGYKIEDYLGILALAKLVGLDVEQVALGDVKDLTMLFEKVPLIDESRRQKALDFMKAKLLAINQSVPSELIESLQVSPEKLKMNLEKIADFLNYYSTLAREEQGQNTKFSKQERLDIIISLTEDPMSAKRALSRIFKRNWIPFDILEQRAYEAFEELQMQKFFEKKGFEGEKAKFPVNKNRILPLLAKEEVQPAIDALEKGQTAEASARLLSAVEKAMKRENKKVEITDANDIEGRLKKVMKLFEWIKTVQPVNGSTYDPAPELMREHLLSENYELLVLRSGYERNAGQIINYIMVQKGYRWAELRTKVNQALSSLGLKPLEGEVKAPEIKTAEVKAPPQTPVQQKAGKLCPSLF